MALHEESDHQHEHDKGLAHDLRVMSRRRMLVLAGGVGAASFGAACATDSPKPTAASTSSAATAAADAANDVTVEAAPAETAGPYPGDGTNGPNILVQNGVVRKDLRSSFGDYTGTAEGVETDLTMSLVDLNTNAAGKGMAVYVWHCTADGEYSLYGNATEANYLRGVQVAGDDGTVSFTTVFPGCYSGRWPHVHFAVYDSLESAISGDDPRLTSQIALPEEACKQVYSSDPVYSASVGNLQRTSLTSDGIFGDGWDAEMATVSGSAAKKIASITIGVAN